jgi:hypothetical protein
MLNIFSLNICFCSFYKSIWSFFVFYSFILFSLVCLWLFLSLLESFFLPIELFVPFSLSNLYLLFFLFWSLFVSFVLIFLCMCFFYH